MKYLHKAFSWLGLSLGGARACKKYGCEEYCGDSPTEYMKFHNIGIGSLLAVKKEFYLIECENGHTFRHKPLIDEGFRKCPRCEGELGKPCVGEENVVRQLKSISVARDEIRRAEQIAQKEKYNKSKAKEFTVNVDMNLDKMQLKLKAIAKHADELANELERIDNTEPCGECGGINSSTHELYKDDKPFLHSIECLDCGVVVECLVESE